MQHPNYNLYKFLEDNIQEVFSSYVQQFVETNKQLMDKDEKIHFLPPPVDFSKLHQGEQAFCGYESVLEAYEQYDKHKEFRVQCFLGNVENTDSLFINFVPAVIPHIVLEPSCAVAASKLKVDSGDYRDHLIRNQIAEVSYCVGKKLRGTIRGIYLLGKIFSNRKLRKLLNKSNHEEGKPTFSDFLKQIDSILENNERSVIKEVEDYPGVLSDYLKEWDSRLLNTLGSEKIHALLSSVDLILKDWLT